MNGEICKHESADAEDGITAGDTNSDQIPVTKDVNCEPGRCGEKSNANDATLESNDHNPVTNDDCEPSQTGEMNNSNDTTLESNGFGLLGPAFEALKQRLAEVKHLRKRIQENTRARNAEFESWKKLVSAHK